MDLSVVELADGRRRVVVTELVMGKWVDTATMSAPISRRAAERLIEQYGKWMSGVEQAEFVSRATAPRTVNPENLNSLREQLRRLGR